MTDGIEENPGPLLGKIMKDESGMVQRPGNWKQYWNLRAIGESEKAGLKLNIQKTKIMASSPVTSWQIDVEKVEAVADLIF